MTGKRFSGRTRGRVGLGLLVTTLLALLVVVAGCGSSGGDESGAASTSRVSSGSSGEHGATAGASRTDRTSSREAGGGGASAGHGAAAPAAGGHATPASDEGEAPHWAYAGDLGPSHWGDLADEFIACKTGTSQSPIDIAGSFGAEPIDIDISYHDAPLRILNNGHTLQVNYAPGSTMSIGHEQYELLQFHFHTPSEHEVGSHSFPMEGHLVHKSASGELAVLGVFIEEGHANPFFQTLADHLPRGAGEENVVSGVTTYAGDLLPPALDAFSYSGSLTTPPCSEGVVWNVLGTPIQASAAQIAAFQGILGHNARPVQPLAGRAISGQHAGEAQASASAGHGEAPHWSYDGQIGPSYWGDLADEFIACKTGIEQSPIDIQTAFTVDSTRSVFTDYGETRVAILNNGHTIQVDYDTGSVAHLDSQEYELLQFHFHTPSENHVNGSSFPMEMHLVHKNAEGGLGVIGVLFEEGDENPLLGSFWNFLPRDVGEVPSDLRIRISDMLPEEPHYYTFDGSLTTPPCSEGVKWFMVNEPVQASRAQMDKFMSIFGGNARPIQPLNERAVGQF